MPTAWPSARRPCRVALPSCELRVKMLFEFRALSVGLTALVILGACSQNSTPQTNSAPTTASQAATVVSQAATAVIASGTALPTIEAHFNPTEAVGGGANSSNAISGDDITAAFKSVVQASQLKLVANSSPPGAKGSDVQSVSVIGQDSSGLLKGLDMTGKRALGDALLTAAGAAWPNASVSLLVTDTTGTGGQIIGSRGAGSPNMVIVS